MTDRYSDRCTDRYTRTPREGKQKGREVTGREGTGRHQKGPQAFRVGPSHHDVAYVTRERSTGMMTATRLEVAS